MSDVKFVDLFAGLGGFRLGLESVGYECVFGADLNEHAARIYKENFGDSILGDVSKLDPADIPAFDVLAGGFPCQPFSRAGATLGFNDTRGTLFFDIMRIVDHHKPKVVFLENVKNLEKHDGGNTLNVIRDSFVQAGYTFSYEVLNAADFGVPQSRERVIIVAVRGDVVFDFDAVKRADRTVMSSILDTNVDHVWLAEDSYTLLPDSVVKTTPGTGLRFCGYLNKVLRAGTNPDAVHRSRTHRQQNRIYSDAGTSCTLSSSEKSGRYYIMTEKPDETVGVRKLTLRECYNLFGYPKSYKLVGSNSDLYERIGNSVCVPMMEAVSAQIDAQVFNRSV